MTTITTPDWVRRAVVRLETAAELDDRLEPLDRAATRLDAGRLGEVLRGDWLGHALHPLLTDLPLGCWTSASLLDIAGGRRARPAARRLVGLGILAALPTAATGLVDFGLISTQRSRRVAAVHAVGNAVAMVAYVRSWQLRRRGDHRRGSIWALAGAGTAAGTGYLGSHLSLARGVGTGERGLDIDARPS